MRRALVAAAFGLVLAVPLPASANHPQIEYSGELAVVHKGGNEWWVEAALVGFSKDQVSKVEARDDDSPWTPLTLRSWGNWAASFHIEPGNRVRFKVTLPDGDTIASCQFTHPAGAEQCRFPRTTSPFPPQESALFDHVGGSFSHVAVRVEPRATDDVSGVSARVEGTTSWTTLRPSDESATGGVWSGSLAVPAGKRVEFEAHRAGGMSDAWRMVSCPFTHPGGDEQCSGGMAWGLDANYRGVSGNEWWFQVQVAASKPLAGVDIRISRDARAGDESSWIALENKGWGWARSLHIPSGSLVEVRSRATDGSFDLSDGAWLWPSASFHPDQTTGWDVEFRDFKGNEWWVQVNMLSDHPIQTVLASDKAPDQPDFMRQTEVVFLHEWGDWGRSFHIEPGHVVMFEVHTVNGQTARTGWMAWPPR
jgi:hypothetical protein